MPAAPFVAPLRRESASGEEEKTGNAARSSIISASVCGLLRARLEIGLTLSGRCNELRVQLAGFDRLDD